MDYAHIEMAATIVVCMDPDVQFTEAEKSRVFIKVTKTKTLAAYGQIVDVLFANNNFPVSIEPTELPEGVVADVHFDPQRTRSYLQIFQARMVLLEMEKNIPPGATEKTLLEKLGPLSDKLEPVEDKLKEGPGKTPTAVEFSPAMIAAKKMQKKFTTS